MSMDQEAVKTETQENEEIRFVDSVTKTQEDTATILGHFVGPPGLWYPLKWMSEEIGFPPVLQDLWNEFAEDGRANPGDVLAVLAVACYVESGLIPVFGEDPVYTTKELEEMSTYERMVNIFQKLRHRSRVKNMWGFRDMKFTFVVNSDTNGNEQESPAQNDKWRGLSRNLIRCSVIVMSETEFLITGEGHKYCRRWLIDGAHTTFKPLREGYSLSNHLEKGVDFVLEFSPKLKESLVYPLLDLYDGVCIETRAFHSLPEELIIRIAKLLDIPSFVRFMRTSRFMLNMLDVDELWGHFCKRIPADFDEKGLKHSTWQIKRRRCATLKDQCKHRYQAALNSTKIFHRLRALGLN